MQGTDRSCYFLPMRKGERTREAIVSEALRTTAGDGFSGLSLGPLAASLGLSKSGLFAHFASKEALELAVLEAAVERFQRRVVMPALNESEGLSRLRALYENYIDWIAGKSGLPGCPFAVLAQEYQDRSGPIRDLLEMSQRQWRRLLAGEISAAAAAGAIERRADPAQLVFELVGAALAFQQEARLMKDRKARTRARAAFDRILGVTR